MNKKVVVFGGGTGMSYLLRGLKQYPLDITAVVSVCDDGGSTGRLRNEFNILAVGDLRKVIVSLSKTESDVEALLNYRFDSKGPLNNHTVGNIMLTAAKDIAGSVGQGIEVLGSVLNLCGKVVPFTEDNIVLMGEMEDDSIVEGEYNITQSSKKIKRVFYKDEPKIDESLLKKIKHADIIILSMGSLYTSVIPTLLSKDIRNAIDSCKAKIVYSCNLFTQPGETDDLTVSDHIKILDQYLGKRKIKYVIANNGFVDKNLAKKYATTEQKDPVVLDEKEVEKLNVTLFKDNLIYIKEQTDDKKPVFRHNYIKLGFLINTLALNYDYLITNK